MKSNAGARVVGTTRGYDLWARRYDRDGNPTTALEERAFRAWLRGRSVRGQKVLDLGCGTGRHSVTLARRGARVVGVDPSAGMLAQARAKDAAGRVEWVRVRVGAALPFRAATFDAAASALVLEHVRDLRAFFAEARRVCRPGAALYVSAMHPAMLLRGSQASFRDRAGRKIRPRGYPHRTRDFLNAALSAGLELERLEELAADARLARAAPRAAKWLGWPMILSLHLRRPR